MSKKYKVLQPISLDGSRVEAGTIVEMEDTVAAAFTPELIEEVKDEETAGEQSTEGSENQSTDTTATGSSADASDDKKEETAGDQAADTTAGEQSTDAGSTV